MDLRILAPLEVLGGDGPLRLGGPNQRAVLAHLIVRADRVVPAGLGDGSSPQACFDQKALGPGAPPIMLIRSGGSQVFEVFPIGSESSLRPEAP